MKLFNYLIVVLCMLFCGNLLAALNVGDEAPSLKISEWVKGEPVNIDSLNKQNKKVCVVFFWATWNNVTPNLMNFISTEKRIYGKDGAVFIGISKEKASIVKKFLNKYPGINFRIGIDNNAETYAEYMQGEKGVPMFFIIDKKKNLIWKGGPFEVNRVLVHAMNDTFNAEKQKQIESYRKDIRKASQMLNRKEEIFYARKILKIDPTDRVAMNIIIDNYIVNGKENKAIDFIRSSRIKAGRNKYILRTLYFLELSLVRSMDNATGKKNLLELVSNYKKVFKDDPNALNSLIIIVTRDVPLAIIPLGEMLDISKSAVVLAKNSNDSELLSSCLQSQARVYYLVGLLNKAIDTQEKAVHLIGKKRQLEKDAALLVDAYYKEALKLNQGKRN